MKSDVLVLDPLTLAARHDEAACSFAGLETTDRAAREDILHRAYSIWESEGHPTDRKLANWLDAEAAYRRQR